MDMNIIVAGVGGQGILSIAFVLDNAAMKEGYHFKQAEVHGMSQRGGAVQSHIRFSKDEIWSDLIPLGGADLILSVEPLESLRYFHYLKPEGVVISSASPFVNISNYPDLQGVYKKIAKLENHVLVEAESLAKLAGSPKAQNMVVLGAAAYMLPFDRASYLEFISLLFKAKGEKAVGINSNAFTYGERMSEFFRAGLAQGMTSDQIRSLASAVDPTTEPDTKSLPVWHEAFKKHGPLFPEAGWGKREKIPGTVAQAEMVVKEGPFLEE